jgi:hypothetical protein
MGGACTSTSHHKGEMIQHFRIDNDYYYFNNKGTTDITLSTTTGDSLNSPTSILKKSARVRSSTTTTTTNSYLSTTDDHPTPQSPTTTTTTTHRKTTLLVLTPPPSFTRSLSTMSSTTNNDDVGDEQVPQQEFITTSPTTTINTRKTRPYSLTRAKSQLITSSNTIKMKALKAIIVGDDNKFEEIRDEIYSNLKKQHASEGFEFIHEIQALVSVTNTMKRHYELNYIMDEFIIPQAPRAICYAAEKRDPIMKAWMNNNDEILFNLLFDLAFGEIFRDVIQNPAFQNFLTDKFEEGVVELKNME